MGLPTKESLYLICDQYNRSASLVGNAVVFNAALTPLQNNPIGWDQVQLQFKTVQKYFYLNRSFTIPLTFVHDGARIIRDRLYRGLGYAEELYLLILKWDNAPTSPTAGQYILEYKGRIDLTQGVTDDPLRGITVSTKEAGAVSFLNANDGVNYEINNDDTNPQSIKVLFDGIQLFEKYNYGISNVTVNTSLCTIPVAFINNEGDSYGIEHNGQGFEPIADQSTYYRDSSNFLFKSNTPLTINVKGRISITNTSGIGNNIFTIFFYTSKGQGFTPYKTSSNNVIIPLGQKRSFDFDLNISLVGEEKLFLVAGSVSVNENYTFETEKFTISFSSRKPATTAYALRPQDLWKQLVSKMTGGRFTGDSNFFATHKNIVAISGESIRNLPNARFKTNVTDFFQSYNAIYNLAIKIVNDVIWIEPKGDLYNDSRLNLDLGEVSGFKIHDANEYYVNTVKTGGPIQDYQNMNNTNGRFEFNSTFEWLMPRCDLKKEYNIVSKYRIDPYGIEFVRAFFDGKNTSDSKSDNEVFLVNISDQKGVIGTPYNNSHLISVNSQPTLPIFLVEYNNATINNGNPTVKGFAVPGTNIGILADGVQDGYTTADQYGFWSYTLVATLSSYAVSNTGTITNTGLHTIGAAYADVNGAIPVAAASTNITVTINTTLTSPFVITSPENDSYIFDNKPIIKGIAPTGANVTVSIDGTVIGTVVADGSCMWQINVTNPLSDGAHTITATTGASSTSTTFNLSFSTIAYPLVTKVNRHTEQSVYTKRPLIEGVGQPNSNFLLYFDYDIYGPQYDANGILVRWGILPQPVTVDANGNWSYQVQIDIPDGDHEISSSSINQQVSINVDGYKLKRVVYDALSGIPTPNIDGPGAAFNIEEMTPKLQLLAHGNYLRSLAYQQPGNSITFQTGDKNKNLSRTKGNITVVEKKDVQVSSLSAPLFLPYVFEFKTKVPLTFAQLMASLGAGDILFYVNGVALYGLPIGELSAKPSNNEAQEWKLLASPKNSLQTLLNLSL